MDREINVKLVNGHYQIYVDGKFKGSCDVGELSETMIEVEEELRNNK